MLRRTRGKNRIQNAPRRKQVIQTLSNELRAKQGSGIRSRGPFKKVEAKQDLVFQTLPKLPKQVKEKEHGMRHEGKRGAGEKFAEEDGDERRQGGKASQG